MNDQIRQLINDAQSDQRIAALAQVAHILGVYHDKLKAAGLSEDQAFALVQDYHTFMFSTSMQLLRSEGD